MRPRTEVAIAMGAVLALVVLGAALGQRENPPEKQDPRASTYITGPRGARGLADGLGRLGLRIERFRASPRQLNPTGDSDRTVLAILDPIYGFSNAEAREVIKWHESTGGGDLLLAGLASVNLMRCFGFQLDERYLDSVQVRGPGRWPKLSAVLSLSSDTVVDSSRVGDTGVWTCAVPPYARIDTLLTASNGRVLALRLVRSDMDRHILLLADATTMRNRAMRETDSGPWSLELLAGTYKRVIFEEAHQGFGTGGSLAAATLDWSIRSPWGWAAWQLAYVGIVMLLAGAFRFGPIRSVMQRKRRSPLEHVRALATALAAAKGHDVAIGSLVQGLRRRLMPAGQRGRADWKSWVERLSQNLRSRRALDAAATLKSLTRPGQPPDGVLRAANAVEDVWEELRP